MLLTLLVFFASPANAASDCSVEKDFSKEAFFTNGEHWTLSLKACELTRPRSKARGKKTIVNLCEPAIQLIHYKVIDDDKPRTIKAGSLQLPKPLFGVDFDVSDADQEDFSKFTEEFLQKAQKVHSWLEVRKDSRLRDIYCTLKKARLYLEQCEPQSIP